MKKELVVKDNALINASYNLDLSEQRLILLAILEARQSNTPNNKDLTIHAESYINHFNVHRNTAYKVLKDACKSLFDRRFSYQKLTKKGNVENVISRWVQRISYVENEALVRIKFSDDVVPLITNLEKHFTSYELEQVSSLTSVYAIRLYELLIAWRSTGKVTMVELEELRLKLGIEPQEYKRMGQFKEKVLHIAIDQINKYTDIKAEYEQHKRGRSIIGFSFKFKHKQQPKKINSKRDPNTLDFFIKMTDAQRHLFANKMSEMPEMSKYSQGTESYQQFAIRIADMLLEPEKFRELYPILGKAGFTL